MSSAPQRSLLHSSALVQCLHRQGLLAPVMDLPELGQQLGDWLDFRHAIALQGFMGTLTASEHAPSAPLARVDARVLRERFAQVRQTLEDAIREDRAPAAGLPLITPPPLQPQTPMEGQNALDPWRRFVLGHQRQMDHLSRSLRVQLRGMLETGNTAQQQLARLDKLFENALLERETRLFGQLAARYEPRLTALLKAECAQATGRATEPTSPARVDLLQDIRQALLAELDVRLQPLLGLIDALSPSPNPIP